MPLVVGVRHLFRIRKGQMQPLNSKVNQTRMPKQGSCVWVPESPQGHARNMKGLLPAEDYDSQRILMCGVLVVAQRRLLYCAEYRSAMLSHLLTPPPHRALNYYMLIISSFDVFGCAFQTSIPICPIDTQGKTRAITTRLMAVECLLRYLKSRHQAHIAKSPP